MCKFLTVVSRYKEDISWTKSINKNILIIDKGTWYPERNGYFLPNYGGREAHSYLHFLYYYYNRLPDWVCFCQGNPFDHCSDIINQINNFNISQQPGFISLGSTFTEKRSDRHIENFIEFWDIGIPVIEETSYTFTMGAQFIVHKQNILKNSREVYKNLYDAVLHYNSTSFNLSTDGKIDNEIAHTMERLWGRIFTHSG